MPVAADSEATGDRVRVGYLGPPGTFSEQALLTILALLTGLAAVFLLQPGAGMHIDPKQLDAAVAAKYASQVPPRGFTSSKRGPAKPRNRRLGSAYGSAPFL